MHNGTQYDIWGVTSVNWQTGAVIVEPWKTKIFTISGEDDYTNAQLALDYMGDGGVALLRYGNSLYRSVQIANLSQAGWATFFYISMPVSVNGQNRRIRTMNIGSIHIAWNSTGTVNSIYFKPPNTTFWVVSETAKEVVISDTVPSSSTSSSTITFVI